MTNKTVWAIYKSQLKKAIEEKNNNTEKVKIAGESKTPDRLIYETKIDMTLFYLLEKITPDELNEIRNNDYWLIRDKIKDEYSRKELTIQKIQEFLNNKTK